MGIFGISSPWGYQLESFFIFSPHIFTLELLQYNNFMDLLTAKLFLSIIINVRTLSFTLDPLINRLFTHQSVDLLSGLVSRLRRDMAIVLPKVRYPKFHWMTTIVSEVMKHGVAQCDYLESMHL